MSDNIIDKATGRAKQAFGDLTGDKETRAEGIKEERKGEAKDEAEQAEEQAAEKRAEAADLETKT